MRSAIWSLGCVAALSSLVGAQDVNSLISLLLGGTSVSPVKGADVSRFSTCTDLASLVASDVSLHLVDSTYSATDVEGVAWGVCTLGGCTGVGLARMDKCCSIANSDYSNWANQLLDGTASSLSKYPTSANDCFSNFKGPNQDKPSSASASATGAAIPTDGSGAALSSSSSGGATAGSASSPTPTSAASANSATGTPSSTQTSATKNGGGHVDNQLIAGSAFAILVGLAGYVL